MALPQIDTDLHTTVIEPFTEARLKQEHRSIEGTLNFNQLCQVLIQTRLTSILPILVLGLVSKNRHPRRIIKYRSSHTSTSSWMGYIQAIPNVARRVNPILYNLAQPKLCCKSPDIK